MEMNQSLFNLSLLGKARSITGSCSGGLGVLNIILIMLCESVSHQRKWTVFVGMVSASIRNKGYRGFQVGTLRPLL